LNTVAGIATFSFSVWNTFWWGL